LEARWLKALQAFVEVLSHGFYVGGEDTNGTPQVVQARAQIAYILAQIAHILAHIACALAQLLKAALHLDLCTQQELVFRAEFNMVVQNEFERPLNAIKPLISGFLLPVPLAHLFLALF
jgi:hypothetical protein